MYPGLAFSSRGCSHGHDQSEERARQPEPSVARQQMNNDELERVVAVHRDLRIKGNAELERVLIAYRQIRSRTKRRGSESAQISQWLAAQFKFAGVRISLFAALVLAWSAARLLQITLRQLFVGSLSKRRARRRLKIARTLNRTSSRILLRQLSKCV